jgi:hypothetical protein
VNDKTGEKSGKKKGTTEKLENPHVTRRAISSLMESQVRKIE